MPKKDLDAIDCRIVSALQADGRLTNVELAERVGLSPSPCLRRVNRLEREGYIETYRAMLGRKRIGLGLSVFVGVKIASVGLPVIATVAAVVCQSSDAAFHCLMSSGVVHARQTSSIGAATVVSTVIFM